MMSILTIGREEIGRRKTASDIKNNTDSLYFEDTKSSNKNAAAYRGVRNHEDDKLIASLENISDADYFADLYNSLDWLNAR